MNPFYGPNNFSGQMLQYPIWAKGSHILSQCMSASYALPIFFSLAKKHSRESPKALPTWHRSFGSLRLHIAKIDTRFRYWCLHRIAPERFT